MRGIIPIIVGAGCVIAAGASAWHAKADDAAGLNPHPVKLLRPAEKPLSAMAELGRLIFFDPSLSSSGQLSCASCHSPQHAYGPPGDLPAMMGGPALKRQGVRATPSLRYLARQPAFSIGPESEEAEEGPSLTQMVSLSNGAARVTKTATQTAQSAANIVPQGGLFWDGRADTLQDQALVPLLNPLEMDGGNIETIAGKLRRAPYGERLKQLFGASVVADPRRAVGEALFAVGRFQIEDASFHPYSSKFDHWLEGKARFSPSEMRGYRLFNDPHKANCAGCHVDTPSAGGLPPLFTDHEYEALGVPRNGALAANRKPAYYDLGLCGPYRADLARAPQYCGMFATPTLRNVATRQVFFHNGVYHTLQEVLDFYDFRDTEPQKIYPRRADGKVAKFNDLPARYHRNIDVIDPPFDRHAGQPPVMSDTDKADIIAFLKTLTDGDGLNR